MRKYILMILALTGSYIGHAQVTVFRDPEIADMIKGIKKNQKVEGRMRK